MSPALTWTALILAGVVSVLWGVSIKYAGGSSTLGPQGPRLVSHAGLGYRAATFHRAKASRAG
ncbi:MAG TPA: hypothetical protein VI009_22265 [Xanthobacteraceae bacterium]